MIEKETILEHDPEIELIEEAADLMEMIKTELNIPFVDKNTVRIVKFMCDIGFPAKVNREEYVHHVVSLFKLLHDKFFN
jgi:hypothetical protein